MGRFFLIFGILSIVHEASSSLAEKQLMRYLFNKSTYDERVRPVVNSSDPLNVTVRLLLYHLIAIEEKDQHIELSAWLTTEWSDYQMQWNPSEYGGLDKINVRSSDIWVPDMVLYNNIDENNAEYGGNMDTLKTRVKVSHTGDVYWSTPLIIKASCKIRVKEFPYDIQKCILTFGSWTFDEAAMCLLTKGIDTTHFLNNSAWNLGDSYAEIIYSVYPSGKYAELWFHLHFQRKSLFYAANMIFPLALMTILTIITFILPSDSGERVGLSVTLMLSATVFMLLVAETTPESSEGLPIISEYVMFCLVLMFFIIVLLCFISRLYHREKTDSPMSQWTRRWILNGLSYTIGVRHQIQSDKNDTELRTSSSDTMSKSFTNNSFANDEAFFKMENGHPGSILRRMSRSSSMNSRDEKQLEFELQRMEEMSGGKHSERKNESQTCSFEEEWRIVGQTADRVSFIIFSIVFVVGTIVFYAPTSYVK